MGVAYRYRKAIAFTSSPSDVLCFFLHFFAFLIIVGEWIRKKQYRHAANDKSIYKGVDGDIHEDFKEDILRPFMKNVICAMLSKTKK